MNGRLRVESRRGENPAGGGATTRARILAGLRRYARAAAAASGPGGVSTASALVSAWFWMLETQLYELFRRDHTRREEDDLVETLTVLWFRTIGGVTSA